MRVLTETFHGTMSRIAPALDENSRTLLIEAEVPNADGALKPGYFAHVTMSLGHDRALFIPNSAVLRYAGVARVFIFKDGAVRSREITTGSAEGDQIEIISGLKQGEKVVISDVDRLADGTPVVGEGAVVILADLCVRRPVFATMFVGVLVVLGWFSYERLGVDLYPKVDMPMVMVQTYLPGAAPEETEARVTKPLEEVINTVTGIDELRSMTLEGVSRIIVEFKLDRDINVGVQDIRDKISTVLDQLPEGTKPPLVAQMGHGFAADRDLHRHRLSIDEGADRDRPAHDQGAARISRWSRLGRYRRRPRARNPRSRSTPTGYVRRVFRFSRSPPRSRVRTSSIPAAG